MRRDKVQPIPFEDYQCIIRVERQTKRLRPDSFLSGTQREGRFQVISERCMSESDTVDLLEQEDSQNVPLAPRAPGCPVPLMPIQLSIVKWMKEAKKADSLRFCTIALRLLGPLDVLLLNRSIAEVVTRHESLRTKIVEVDGVPRQHVDQPLDHYLDVVDLHQIPPSLCEEEVQKLSHEFADEKIDLAVGPLFAARLFKLSDDEHVLIVAVDHIIMDRVSMGILNREIWTVYHQAVQGLPASLPQLHVQYGDYAVWLHKTLGIWRKKHEAHWRERLSGASALKLPLGAVPPGMNDSSRLDILFGKPLTDKLRKLARREGALLSTVVLAVYFAVMSRWYDKKDLIMWFVSNGRFRPELRNMIGFVVHGLTLRIAISDDDSFLDLLKRVNFEIYSANEHRDFGWLPHILEAPKTDLSFNWGPGWAVGNVHGAIDGSGIRIQPFPLRKKLPGFNAGFFNETPDGIVMYAYHTPEVIAPHIIKSFGDGMVSVADEFAEHPSERIGSFLHKISACGSMLGASDG